MVFPKFTIGLAATIGLVAATPITTRQSKLDKPPIDPPIGDVSNALLQALPTANATLVRWTGQGSHGYDVPQVCADAFAQNDLDARNDLEVYNVTFPDCDQPWIICRHVSAPLSAGIMTAWYGKVPVALRSLIDVFVALPALSHGGTADTTRGNAIIVQGNVNFATFVHDIGARLDYRGFQSSPFSESETWLNAYNQDERVATARATINQFENFAEEVVLALYDVRVRGGLPVLTSLGYMKIKYQIDVIETQVQPNTFNPTSECKCKNRLPLNSTVTLPEASPKAKRNVNVFGPTANGLCYNEERKYYWFCGRKAIHAAPGTVSTLDNLCWSPKTGNIHRCGVMTARDEYLTCWDPKARYYIPECISKVSSSFQVQQERDV